MMPMLALYADWDFGMEKGMKVFFGGKAHDDWNRMGEIWLWLWTQYETGYPPEEAVARLEAEGFRVELEEAKPRKERPAGQRRVVRQAAEDGVCRLTWSNFKA